MIKYAAGRGKECKALAANEQLQLGTSICNRSRFDLVSMPLSSHSSQAVGSFCVHVLPSWQSPRGRVADRRASAKGLAMELEADETSEALGPLKPLVKPLVKKKGHFVFLNLSNRS